MAMKPTILSTLLLIPRFFYSRPSLEALFFDQRYMVKMQGAIQPILLHGNTLKHAVLQHFRVKDTVYRSRVLARFESTSFSNAEHTGLENTTVADVLQAKGEGADGSWLWCYTDDTVYDAVKHMTEHNVGALVVIKPGEQRLIEGIITERDYLRKMIVQGRSARSTKVRDIMTEENKLITVSSDTNVVEAMQLMTEKHIRHVPVIDGRMVGMVSIGDIVRAVVGQQHHEVNRLNEYIRGDYLKFHK